MLLVRGAWAASRASCSEAFHTTASRKVLFREYALLGVDRHRSLTTKVFHSVMVARKRLKLPALPRGKGDVVSNVRARHMRLDQAMIEKDANVAEEDPEGKDKQDDAGEESEKKQDAADSAAAEEEEGDAKEGTDKREAEIGQVAEIGKEEKEDQVVRDKNIIEPTSEEVKDKTDKQGEGDQDEEERGRRRAGEHEKVQMEEEEPRGRNRSRVAEGQ